VLLQRKGAAAFVVLTEAFGDQIQRVMTYHSSDIPLPAVVIDHPMQNVGVEELKARARQIADSAERLLKGENP